MRVPGARVPGGMGQGPPAANRAFSPDHGTDQGANPAVADGVLVVRHTSASNQGDRQANTALWNIVITRMVCDQRTREYIAPEIYRERPHVLAP